MGSSVVYQCHTSGCRRNNGSMIRVSRVMNLICEDCRKPLTVVEGAQYAKDKGLVECPMPGVAERHSDSFYDDGSCTWCGAKWEGPRED